MAKEFGPSDYKNDQGYTNTGRAGENRATRANPAPREFHDYSVQSDTAPRESAGRGHSLFRSLAVTAAAAVAAVAIIPSVLEPPLDVDFAYLYATDTEIEYVLNLGHYEADDDPVEVLIVTPNGNTVNSQTAEGEVVTGRVTGLRAESHYEVVVKDGGTTVASRAVTTAARRLTALEGVEHECRCAVDGTFHFRLLGFCDENGYWSDFRATLTDAYGTMSVCDFPDTPGEPHTLAVNEVGMRGSRAVLRIVCTTTEPDETGGRTPRERVLYEAEVAI